MEVRVATLAAAVVAAVGHVDACTSGATPEVQRQQQFGDGRPAQLGQTNAAHRNRRNKQQVSTFKHWGVQHEQQVARISIRAVKKRGNLQQASHKQQVRGLPDAERRAILLNLAKSQRRVCVCVCVCI